MFWFRLRDDKTKRRSGVSQSLFRARPRATRATPYPRLSPEIQQIMSASPPLSLPMGSQLRVAILSAIAQPAH